MKHSSRAAVAFAVTVLAAHGGQPRPGCPARGGFSPGAGQDRLRGSRRADFDDGPDPAATPRFLDALETLAVRATFFVLGQEVARHPRLAGQIACRGHELAVHGWAHDRPWLPTPPAGRPRPPKGRHRRLRRDWPDPAVVPAALRILTGGRLAAAAGCGLRPVLWSARDRDWTTAATRPPCSPPWV